ncbi:MAG: hypothetical protein ACTSP1_08400 [Candidatus Freyarchaeota archaeon]
MSEDRLTRRVARRLDLLNPALSFVLFGVADYLFPRVNWYLGFPSLFFTLPFRLPYWAQLSLFQAVAVILLLSVLPLPPVLILRMVLWRLSETHPDYGDALETLRKEVTLGTVLRSARVFLVFALGSAAAALLGAPFTLLLRYGYRELYILPGNVAANEFYQIFFVCLLASVALSALAYRLLRAKLA